MLKINIILNNRNWKSYIKNPSNYFQKRIFKFNKKFKKYQKNNIFFSLLLSNDTHIKRLNKKFRKKNKTTDVLSFPFYKKKDLKDVLKKEKEVYLGDIIINLNKIKKKKDISYFKLELNKLWIHGLVHLLGYDHKKETEFYKMNKVEKRFISYLK